jgi:hypothetical protein
MHRSISLRRVIDVILFALAFGFLLFTTLFAHATPRTARPALALEPLVPVYTKFNL